jgi:hypothetical protein
MSMARWCETYSRPDSESFPAPPDLFEGRETFFRNFGPVTKGVHDPIHISLTIRTTEG